LCGINKEVKTYIPQKEQKQQQVYQKQNNYQAEKEYFMSNLSEEEIRILLELKSIVNITNQISQQVQLAVDNTSPGGNLYESQNSANESLIVWKEIFQSSKQ